MGICVDGPNDPENAYVDSWQSPFRKDPFEIPLETQLTLLLAADAEMRRVKGVTLTETDMQFRKIDSWFASSIGSRIHQRKVITGCGIVATSFQGDEIQKRSYPNSFGGQHALQGYELVESLDLLKHAPVIAEEAVALHAAAQCPQKTGTLILGASQLGLQIHESVGHPIELDRVLGQEANFAGTSFLTLDQLNKLRYASDDRGWGRLPTTTKACRRNARTSSRPASSAGIFRIGRPRTLSGCSALPERCARKAGIGCRSFA